MHSPFESVSVCCASLNVTSPVRLHDCISSFALHVWGASLMISYKHVPVVVVVAVVVVVVGPETRET